MNRKQVKVVRIQISLKVSQKNVLPNKLKNVTVIPKAILVRPNPTEKADSFITSSRIGRGWILGAAKSEE